MAAVLRVPSEFATVLEAVDNAAPSDTVLVGPGVWADTETRVVIEGGLPSQVTACAFPMHGMSIIGEAGATQTTLDVGGSGSGYIRVVAWKEGTTGALVVQGLTIRGINGPQYAVGIRALDAGLVIVRDCVFEGSGNAQEGAALRIGGSSGVQFTGCKFRDLSDEEGLIHALDTPVSFTDCEFERITGRCIHVNVEYGSATALIEDCMFLNVRGRGNGCSIGITGLDDFTIRGCWFVENTGTDLECGAVYVGSSTGVVEFNQFVRDSSLVSGGAGGGLCGVSSSLTVANNTFVSCYSHPALGGAAFIGASCNITFTSNAVVQSSGAAALNSYGSVVSENSCNLYWENAAGDFGVWPPPTGLEWHADPLFCDPVKLDFTVRDDSPCIFDNGCGQIGAEGVGCYSVSTDPWSWGRIKSAYRNER